MFSVEAFRSTVLKIVKIFREHSMLTKSHFMKSDIAIRVKRMFIF